MTPRVWGHTVSDDGLHWKQLPVALSTDTWYDKGGVYTGSATVLDDAARTPVLSYSVNTNDMQALAFPANRSDPELVESLEWVKPSYNPIIRSSRGAPLGRDDIGMWRTADGGHYLMAYGTEWGAVLFKSPRCPRGAANLPSCLGPLPWTQETWLMNNTAGNATLQWEMPDLYPVPPGGAAAAATGSSQYVMQAGMATGWPWGGPFTAGSCPYVTGVYDSDVVRFTPADGQRMGDPRMNYDYGSNLAPSRGSHQWLGSNYYACHTHLDGGGRRMLLAYLRDAVNSTHDGAPDNFCSTRFPDVTALTAAAGAQYVRPLPFELGTCNWASVQALPRIVTTAAGGARVQLRPLPEMASLGIGPSVRLGPTTLTPSSAQPLAVNISNGRQFELLVRFRAAPVRGAKCGVQLLGSLEKGPDGSAREFTEVGVGYDLDGRGSARTIGPSRVQGYVDGARHSMLKAVPGPTALAPIFCRGGRRWVDDATPVCGPLDRRGFFPERYCRRRAFLPDAAGGGRGVDRGAWRALAATASWYRSRSGSCRAPHDARMT